MNIPWTIEREAILREMWPKHSAREIMTAMPEMSRNAIIGKARRLGLISKRLGAARLAPRRPQEPRSLSLRQKSFIRLPPTPLPVEQAPPEGGVHIMDLRPQHCRFVFGEPRLLTFCGCQVVEGTSWCAEHRKIFTQASIPRITKPAAWNGLR